MRKLYFLLTFCSTFVLQSIGQTVIISEDFENGFTLFSSTGGGAFFTGNSASGDRPASSPFASSNSYSYGISNGNTILTSNAINTSSFPSVQLIFRAASFSIGSTANGADAGDFIGVEVSPDGGTTFYHTIEVRGAANARWSYASTGSAGTSYDGNTTTVSFAPAGGGDRDDDGDGYSTVSITGLPSVSDLRVRITLFNDAAAERWVIDDFKVIGNSVISPTLSATTLAAFGNVCVGTTATNSFTLTSNNLNGSDVTIGPLAGYAFSTTSGGTFTSSLIISGYSGGAINQEIFVRFAPTAVQSYSGNIPVSGGGATAINVAASGSGVNTSPTVSTGAATWVTTNSATLSGTLSGGCSVTAYGVEYNTTSGFTPGTGTQMASSNLNSGSFSVTVTGLAASTNYYYRAYATNSAGTTYGAQQTFVTSAPAVNPRLVISQVYGGGGNSGATYSHDFIEIFNPTNAAIRLNGLSVQYAAATGTSWAVTPLVDPAITTDVFLQPGQYYLIQEASNAAVGAALPTPDATGTISLAAGAGKVALVNGTTALTGTCPVGGPVIDFVGYGTTANCSETTVAPATSATTAILRNNNGCADTNNNTNDFTADAPAPRNTASTRNECPVEAPLPVRFTNIKATKKANSVEVSFTNMTESEVLGYTIERSADGQQYSVLTRITTVKNNGSRADYSFVDVQPLSGINYYRVKAEEIGGKAIYSIAVKLHTGLLPSGLTVYPNPIKGNHLSFQINNLVKGSYKIIIHSAAGQLITNESLQHQGGTFSQTLPLPSLKTGLYYLQVNSNSEKLRKAFVVQ